MPHITSRFVDCHVFRRRPGTGLTSERFIARAKKVGVLCLNRDAGPVVRFVTHRNVSAGDVALAIERLEDLLG